MSFWTASIWASGPGDAREPCARRQSSVAPKACIRPHLPAPRRAPRSSSCRSAGDPETGETAPCRAVASAHLIGPENGLRDDHVVAIERRRRRTVKLVTQGDRLRHPATELDIVLAGEQTV